jgi:hypothetical protein
MESYYTCHGKSICGSHGGENGEIANFDNRRTQLPPLQLSKFRDLPVFLFYGPFFLLRQSEAIMGRHRFPIAALMAGVVFLALGLAVLRSGSSASFRAFYAATLLALLLAIIAARYRPGGEGAFWFGFAVFGWGYFLIGIGPWSEWGRTTITGHGEYLQLRANPLLPTEGLIERLADYHAGHLRPPLTGKNVTVSPEVFRAHAKALAGYTEVRESVIGFGHLISVWVLGAVGGWISWLIARYRPSSNQASE